MDRDTLIDQAASAHREQRADGTIADSPQWHDLDAVGRRAAHTRALAQRALESATSPTGLSATARAVLAKLQR
jgi:hypothetical protein